MRMPASLMSATIADDGKPCARANSAIRFRSLYSMGSPRTTSPLGFTAPCSGGSIEASGVVIGERLDLRRAKFCSNQPHPTIYVVSTLSGGKGFKLPDHVVLHLFVESRGFDRAACTRSMASAARWYIPRGIA